MSLTIGEKKGSSVPLLEPGTYAAICCEVIDLGMQYNETFRTTARKVLIGWEVVGESIIVNGEQVPRVFSKTYTATLNEKGSLRKALNAWRGRPFTEEELRSFDLRSIIGAPCMISVIHNTSQTGNTYAVLASISALPKGYPKPTPTAPIYVCDIDADDPAKVDELPTWIGDLIKKSGSYEERLASATTPHLEEVTEAEADGDLPF